MKPTSSTSPAPIAPLPIVCPHQRRQFRKVPGSSIAVLYCLDCGHQEQMSMDEALQRVISHE